MNNDLSMSKDSFKEVLSHYLDKPFFVGMDASDLEDIFYLVEDLLKAEKTAIEEAEPYATRTVDRLETARHEVFMMSLDIGDAFDECFSEGVK